MARFFTVLVLLMAAFAIYFATHVSAAHKSCPSNIAPWFFVPCSHAPVPTVPSGSNLHP